MPPKAKRQRVENDAGLTDLQRLLHTGGISVAGLSQLLQRLGVEHVSRNSLGRENDRLFQSLCCSEELPLQSGGSWKWEYLDPNKLFASRVAASPAVASLVAEAIRSHGAPSLDQPWSLVVGFDEFFPGNKLQTDNRRKTMVLSFSFREFGQLSLCRDEAWQTPVCVRSSQMRKVIGGWPRLLKIFLTKILLGESGLATVGLPLTINGEPFLLYARLTNLLSDGDGHRVAMDWRGQGSMKPCFKHFNVLKKDLGA
jgi:hypothetical protein